MSWMKRPQGGAEPPPGTERQPYAPPQPQPYGNHQDMYPNYQMGPAAPAGTQQYWQAPGQQQPQYNQQYGQVYQQQDFGTNANQLYQQPTQYNQNYNNQALSMQQGYQQQHYPNQGVQPNLNQNQSGADGWEDNWDWGWDESAKQAQKAASAGAQQHGAPQQQPFNNANVIEESFASTNTWNWAMEDKREKEPPAPRQEVREQVPVSAAQPGLVNSSNEPLPQKPPTNAPQPPVEEVRTLNDRDAVKERLPNLALGKRFHIDNLTPQWSIESQMSQESSDGPHTHSEGTYRSDNQSRNSSKSSPGFSTENSNFNYPQAPLEDTYPHSTEWSRHSDEPSVVGVQNGSRRESHDELSNSLQEMVLTNNEKPSTHDFQLSQGLEVDQVQESLPVVQPPPSASPANLPSQISSNISLQQSLSPLMPPAPPVTGVHVPPPATQPFQAPPSSLPPPPSSSAAVPPANFPPTSSQNPFKLAGSFSHKSAMKPPVPASSLQSFPPQVSNNNLTSPAVVNKIAHRVPVGFEANLETTPDNSESPDQPHMSAFRPMQVSQQVPDNLEVAPQNDRNEYLQTAHLSGGDYGENTDFSRNVPPPGLRRMVVGQQESEYNQNLNMSGDEPPPGLARMVPGQQTEAANSYNQASDNYMDRHIDGQPTDPPGRPYRHADGQQTADNYSQPTSNRGTERRPIGLDRMVPGEPSNDEFPQYQGSNYAGSNEQRVVMGVDHDYPIPADAGPTDVREQNMDGSDYTEQVTRNPPRNVIGAREASSNVTPDFPAPDDHQREVTMEGENLQDLSLISSVDLSYSRDQAMVGADVTITDGTDRKTDLSDSLDHPATSSRRQSLNRVNTSGEDSERDRAFKASPRRDRDKHKSSRDRDRDRERDRERNRDKEGRYSRGDRKLEVERRPERERRERERRDSPESRRKRSTRSHRYETEDTDCYSDRERDRRRYREGSYTSSKPPRDDKARRHEERERARRYATEERDRRPDDRERRPDDRRSERRDRHDRHDRRYRDIDPSSKYGNLRRERDEEERRRVVTFSPEAKSNDSSRREGEPYSGGSRPESREAPEDDARRRRPRHRPDPYYDGYGGGGAYLAQQRQYEYYERLRVSDPAAYLRVYKQLMAAQPPALHHDYRHHAALYTEGYASLAYDGRTEDRGSVHSGRSSTNGHKGNDTYYGAFPRAASLRDAPSLRTDVSDRDLTTDASLNLHLEESTVRSERMTPFRYSTAHIKGSISSRDVVVVRPSYPVDGRPATVQLVSLRAALLHLPHSLELTAFPGPLVKGVTHKKSVIEYCWKRARAGPPRGPAGTPGGPAGTPGGPAGTPGGPAGTPGGPAGTPGGPAGDALGYSLMWELLALLLSQNGVVVGTDIAELLMKNARDHPAAGPLHTPPHSASRRESSASGERDDPPSSPSVDDITMDQVSGAGAGVGEREAVDRLREYLVSGNRQDAIEWAVSNKLWGHAMQLGALTSRRARASVAARFLAALPATDPLHTLYAALAATTPPAATCVCSERWGDWRPHAAMVLANPSAKPDHDRHTMALLGDSLSSRGLIYSAQFCYLAGGVQLARHPLAPMGPPLAGPPPRLWLLLGDPRATTLAQMATNEAIFATEIYEYALSLNSDYVLPELQVYKLLLATRYADVGAYERALAYTEQASRAVTAAPLLYPRPLPASLALLADRLRYQEPSLQEETGEEPDSGEPSPRHHQWLHDLQALASNNTVQEPAPIEQDSQQQQQYYQQQQQYWPEQPVQQYQSAQYPEGEEGPQHGPPAEPGAPDEPPQNDWPAPSYDTYWQPDHSQYSYNEGGAAPAEGAPQISMPGATSQPYYGYDDDRPPSADQDADRETDSATTSKKEGGGKEGGTGEAKRTGWLGGLFNKLALRAPNQMILPDDKNPTIVWDAEHKRWRNLDSDGDDSSAPPPPPPTMADLQRSPQSASPPLAPAVGAPPPAAPAGNIFKMQKGRHIKNSYVDVLNPGAAGRPAPLAAPLAPLAPMAPMAPLGPTPTYFVPGPAPAQGTFYDPNANGEVHRSGI